MPGWRWSIHPTVDGLIRAIETMNCGIVVEDKTGAILYANQRLLEWAGYSPEELEGELITTLVPEEFRAGMDSERDRVLNGDLRTRLSAFRRRDGRTFPVAIAPQVVRREGTDEVAVLALLFDLGEVQTARPIGAEEGSLAAELAQVALRLQSLSFSAAMANQAVVPADHPLLKELSGREKEILQLLMAGSRAPAIAKQLHISPHTVRNHLKAVFRKVDVSSQGELIALVRSLGKLGSSDTAGDATT